jgi:hypothetical protein
MTTDTLETAYPFFARINPEREGQIAHWAQKFSIGEQELRNIITIAGPVVKDIHDYLQTLKPQHIPSMPYEQLLQNYQVFINKTITNYLDDYKSYVAQGGTESYFNRCWKLMMNETVEQANRIVDDYGDKVIDRVQLVNDLHRIAEESLLNSKVSFQ